MPYPLLNAFLSLLPSGPINPVPDNRSASTFNFDYLLVDGKIFIRSATPNSPKTFYRGDIIPADNIEWKLFDGLGVPYDEDMQSLLSSGEKIVEIGVASEIVAAVSNNNRVYLYKPTEYTRPLCWESLLGAPDLIKDKLFLPPDRRAWAFSCSVRTKPEVRTTEFMNKKEIVTFFSDANGVNFDFGFTPTIYVLGSDGFKISYWDTGLPTSFSRGFLVPDGVQGLSISAAGSTVFLSAVDSKGALHFYTRMIDYEINGGCPGLAVSYTDIPIVKPNSPSGSFFLGEGIRKMPLKGWVEHEVDDILANLTDKVCIRLTGQGDKARQLRIQGQHPELGWGYFYKNIFETSWDFYPEPAAEPVDHAPVIPFTSVIPPTLKLSYDGVMYARQFPDPRKKSVSSEITLGLENFHPFLTDAEPFSFVIKHPDDSSLYLKIHAVDAWGLHYHKEHDEQLIGSVDGEPKALIGTLILTPEQRELAQNEQSPLGVYLKEHFLEYDGKTKAIPIIADNSMVIIRFDHKDFRFKRTLTNEEIEHSFYMKKVMDSQLNRVPNNPKECADLLSANENCLKEIEKIFSSRRKKDALATSVNFGIEAGHPIVSLFFKVASPQDPTYKQAVEDTKLLFYVHRKARSYSAKGKTQAPGYERAVAVLKQRIESLQEIKSQYEIPSKLLNSCTFF